MVNDKLQLRMSASDYRKKVISKIKEVPRQKQILEYLATRQGKFWRNNTGAAVYESKGKKRFVRFGVKGQGDITGILKGRRIEIETKTDTGILSTDQKLFRDMIIAEGGVYVVARRLADVVNAGL